MENARDSVRAAASSVLLCPACGSGMEGCGGAIRCKAGHSYDVAKEGYVNLLRRAVRAKYDTRLFQARRRVAEAGLWEPLLDAISDMIADGPKLRLLDAGCGEGSHLYGLLRRLEEKGCAVQGYGMDLAKEGVRMGAKRWPEAFWCVGDLAAAPFRSGCFDALVNVLAPSNYREFRRLLKPGGRLVKVVPNAGHLIELRRALYPDMKEEPGEADRTAQLFAGRLADARRFRLSYRVRMDDERAGDLLRMTPLSWGTGAAGSEAVRRIGGAITVDVTLLTGRTSLTR